MTNRALKDGEEPKEPLYDNWQEYIKNPTSVSIGLTRESPNDKMPDPDKKELEKISEKIAEIPFSPGNHDRLTMLTEGHEPQMSCIKKPEPVKFQDPMKSEQESDQDVQPKPISILGKRTCLQRER